MPETYFVQYSHFSSFLDYLLYVRNFPIRSITTQRRKTILIIFPSVFLLFFNLQYSQMCHQHLECLALARIVSIIIVNIKLQYAHRMAEKGVKKVRMKKSARNRNKDPRGLCMPQLSENIAKWNEEKKGLELKKNPFQPSEMKGDETNVFMS